MIECNDGRSASEFYFLFMHYFAIKVLEFETIIQATLYCLDRWWYRKTIKFYFLFSIFIKFFFLEPINYILRK